MAFRNQIRCYIYDQVRIPRLTSFLNGEENALAREMAVNRRHNLVNPTLAFTPEMRVCHACLALIRRDIDMLQNDPQATTLNVLTPNYPDSFLVCRGNDDVHRLSLEYRVDVYVKRNIYIPLRIRATLSDF